MAHKQVVYRLPETDSDEDDLYDGLRFGNYVKPVRTYVRPVDQDLHEALLHGDLSTVQEEIVRSKFNVDDIVNESLPPLHITCQGGFYDIMKYFLKKCNANVNKEDERSIPLLLACKSYNKDSSVVDVIIQLLLEHDAAINVSGMFCGTPFKWTCENVYRNAVKLMITKTNATIINKEGKAAIFRAIKSNRREIVQILIEAGVNYIEKRNGKSYTPTEVAKFNGFYDLLKILPEGQEMYLPSIGFIYSNTIENYIPRILPKTNCPEYFQEMYAMKMEHTIKYFIEARTPLMEFLCMQDKDLENVAIKLPLHRMQIGRDLLDFDDILMIIENQMQHLITIQASLQNIINNVENNNFDPVDMESIEDLEQSLADYRKNLKQLIRTVIYLTSISPSKNPIHIGEEDRIALKEKPFLKGCIKYGIAIGISAFAFLALKRFLH